MVGSGAGLGGSGVGGRGVLYITAPFFAACQDGVLSSGGGGGGHARSTCGFLAGGG